MDNKRESSREREREREEGGVSGEWCQFSCGCVSVVTGECVSVVTGECVSVCVSGDW